MSYLKDELKEKVSFYTSIFSVVGFLALAKFALYRPGCHQDVIDYVIGYLTHAPIQPPSGDCARDTIASAILIALTVIWYFRYRHAVMREIGLIDNAFPSSAIPSHVKGLSHGSLIPVVGVLLVFSFATLILTASNILWYSACALVLSAVDISSNAVVIQNISRFSLRAPDAEDFAGQRRAVIVQYYLDNPTMVRVAGTLCVTLVIFMLAVVLGEDSPYRVLLYGLMSLNIIVGEMTMYVWRRRRDQRLEEICAREYGEDAALTANRTPAT